MQPKTAVTFDQLTFRNMKRTLVPLAETGRKRREDPAYAAPVPYEIGIKLNNGCNLRCKHCFEWNPEGFHHGFAKEVKNDEIEIPVVEKLLAETRERKSRVFLWGGEPLFYSKFDELAELLAKEDRYTTICTNAILIEQKLDSILKMSENLVMLVSLEGFEKENDAIRGKGTFKKVIHAVKLLLDLQKQGIYKGKVSVALTVNDQMVGQLYDFMEYFEEMGVDSVYFCFPWYIPNDTAEKMDTYFDAHFPHLAARFEEGHKNSWHSFTFHISPDNFDTLIEDLNRVNSRVWNVRVRYQPALEPEEVEGFIRGSEKPAMKRTKCFSISNRMDVMPDGKVNPCKFFPEFSVGNLNEDSVADIFHGEDLRKQREVLACGLMPICSKCVLLYNNGI
ncbi:radical SAM protein [Paenibacillus sp. UNC499MF]|uniref:radical SAM protein n=1 Tax=Paenibacillus sp. UNC499MF TaxID=1502751 RepID=UPI0008A064DA|nr:radical SAM protein [Paenibacillus sp. UNC499MF]SEG52169.1 radical SAM additional 4Fe4S-binding SPASM domain-containing protein [Paenibacillus sp. UNC499MF]